MRCIDQTKYGCMILQPSSHPKREVWLLLDQAGTLWWISTQVCRSWPPSLTRSTPLKHVQTNNVDKESRPTSQIYLIEQCRREFRNPVALQEHGLETYRPAWVDDNICYKKLAEGDIVYNDNHKGTHHVISCNCANYWGILTFKRRKVTREHRIEYVSLWLTVVKRPSWNTMARSS